MIVPPNLLCTRIWQIICNLLNFVLQFLSMGTEMSDKLRKDYNRIGAVERVLNTGCGEFVSHSDQIPVYVHIFISGLCVCPYSRLWLTPDTNCYLL